MHNIVNPIFWKLLIVTEPAEILEQVGQTDNDKVVTLQWQPLAAVGFVFSQTRTSGWLLFVEYQDVAPLQYCHISSYFYLNCLR